MLNYLVLLTPIFNLTQTYFPSASISLKWGSYPLYQWHKVSILCVPRSFNTSCSKKNLRALSMFILGGFMLSYMILMSYFHHLQMWIRTWEPKDLSYDFECVWLTTRVCCYPWSDFGIISKPYYDFLVFCAPSYSLENKQRHSHMFLPHYQLIYLEQHMKTLSNGVRHVNPLLMRLRWHTLIIHLLVSLNLLPLVLESLTLVQLIIYLVIILFLLFYNCCQFAFYNCCEWFTNTNLRHSYYQSPLIPYHWLRSLCS